ncbi:MAG: GAF domain-containing protein, partial [Anaerolineales bacterium]
QNLTATLDPGEVAARALDQICSAFGASRGNVLVIRSDQQQLRLLAAQDTDPGWNEQLERQVERRIGEGVAGWVAAHRTPTIVDDVRHDARWVPVPGVGDRIRSVASLPLVAGDVLLGVLNLQSEKPQNFQVEQLPLLTAAVAAVAVALQNAQLFEGMSRQAREVTAASEILHALNATPDVTAVFPFIAANLKTLTDCERVSLALLDANRETFVMTAVDQPRPEVPLGLRLPIRATAAASDVLAGEAHLTPDLATEVDFPAERALYQAGHRSRINLPLRVGRQVVGALNLVWSRPNAYRLSNLPLLAQIADALALALEKSRLFNETRQRDAILQALAYAGERLLMPGHLGEVLPEVLARLGRAAKVSRAYIFENHVDAESVLLNSQRYEWTAPGHIPQLHNPRLQNLAYVAGGFGRWAETLGAGQPLHGVVRDFPASERGLLEQRAIRSIAVAPIVSGGVWWGYLGFDDCEQERNWSAAELEALKSTADALGAAFARQRSEIAERDQRALAEALHDTAAALNSTLDFDKVLDRILTNVGKVVPHDAATIMLIEARTARIVRGRDYTDNRLAPNLLDLRLPIREAPNLRRIMETGRSLAIPDTQTSPGWLPLPEADWVRSYAGTPIKQKGRLIGFINLYSATPNFFGPAQAERLRSFTDQAGVAIENAQLYDQILQHAESLERRVAERTRALAEVNAELQQLDRLKDQFISNVSHELRTPITNIKLHLSLLDKRGPEVLPRYLPTLQRETERLRGLIEDLLDLSRLQTEAMPLRRVPHSLDELASEVIAAHTARAEAKGLAIKHDLNPESLNAPVDRAQIMQVFNNLLGNAVAYTPPGGQITITSQHEKNGEKAGVAVRFRNTSPIIPPEDLPHLFKRFYRGRT